MLDHWREICVGFSRFRCHVFGHWGLLSVGHSCLNGHGPARSTCRAQRACSASHITQRTRIRRYVVQASCLGLYYATTNMRARARPSNPNMKAKSDNDLDEGR